MNVATRRLTKRQMMSLHFQCWAPREMPRAQLERIVPYVAADALACALSLAGGKLTIALGRVAEAVVRLEAWKPHGYKSATDFARERLDRSSRWLRDLATLGRGLSLPGLDEAVWGGDGKRPLGRVAATAIARVATSESIDTWIQLARGTTVRALQRAVREARQAGTRAPVLSSGVEPSARRVLEPDLEVEETFEARLTLPPAIHAAFEEAFELHRAVTGHRASLTSFAEALSAEACAGPCPPDTEVVRIEQEDRSEALEERLASDTKMWKILGLPQLSRGRDHGSGFGSGSGSTDHLAPAPASVPGHDAGAGDASTRPIPFDPTATDTRPEMAAVRMLLRRIESRIALASTDDAKSLVQELRELVALESEVERALGRLLSEMDHRRDWACLQFRNLGHYAEQRLGISRRTAARRAGLVRVLRPLPQIRMAYENGRIGQHAAWLLHGIFKRGATRYSPAETGADSGHPHPGTPSGRSNGPRPATLQSLDAHFAQPWILRARQATLKRLGDDARWATLLEFGLLGIEDARGGFPLPPSDARWHASLRRVPGLSRERILRLGEQALHNERRSGRNGDVGRSRDNVFLRLHLPEDLAALFLACVESARRNLHERASTAESSAGAPPSLRAAVQFRDRNMPVPGWVGLLALLEEYVRVWDDPTGAKNHEWDATYERDGYRCMAPGCTAQCGIEDHHIQYRAHKGCDEAWNQLCLCTFHHQQGEHGRFARCRGRAPLGVLWRLGTPELGTWFRNERRVMEPVAVWREPNGERMVQAFRSSSAIHAAR